MRRRQPGGWTEANHRSFNAKRPKRVGKRFASKCVASTHGLPDILATSTRRARSPLPPAFRKRTSSPRLAGSAGSSAMPTPCGLAASWLRGAPERPPRRVRTPVVSTGADVRPAAVLAVFRGVAVAPLGRCAAGAFEHPARRPDRVRRLPGDLQPVAARRVAQDRRSPGRPDAARLHRDAGSGRRRRRRRTAAESAAAEGASRRAPRASAARCRCAASRNQSSRCPRRRNRSPSR